MTPVSTFFNYCEDYFYYPCDKKIVLRREDSHLVLLLKISQTFILDSKWYSLNQGLGDFLDNFCSQLIGINLDYLCSDDNARFKPFQGMIDMFPNNQKEIKLLLEELCIK